MSAPIPKAKKRTGMDLVPMDLTRDDLFQQASAAANDVRSSLCRIVMTK